MLNVEELQKDLEKAIYESADKTYTGIVDKQTQKFANKLAIAITNHIKRATIIVPAGILLQAGANPGATTEPKQATIN